MDAFDRNGARVDSVGSVHLSSPLLPLQLSSGYFSEEVGTDDMSLGCDTLALQGGTQPIWKRLFGPHPRVMELGGS